MNPHRFGGRHDGGPGFDIATFFQVECGVTANLAKRTARWRCSTYGGRARLVGIEGLTGTIFQDTLIGDAKTNELFGDRGADTLRGGGGDDILSGNAGADLVVGANGGDVVFGSGGRDKLVGSGGPDFLFGMGGEDRLLGGGGQDVLAGGPGSDRMDAGAGVDTISFYRSRRSVRANLGTGRATGEGADRFAGAEALEGTKQGDDELIGSRDGDGFFTWGGDDTVVGRGGWDLAFDGTGNDSFDGGPGSDLVSYFFFDANGVTADLASGTVSGAGTDALTSVESFEGTGFGDVADGADGVTFLLGGGGADILRGGGGNDEIFGLAGDDELFGDANDDLLDGGPGYDDLDGGDDTDDCRNGENVVNCETETVTVCKRCPAWVHLTGGYSNWRDLEVFLREVNRHLNQTAT